MCVCGVCIFLVVFDARIFLVYVKSEIKNMGFGDYIGISLLAMFHKLSFSYPYA